MPLLAFALGKGFALEDVLLVGLVLVGTCPGGTSSNVMSYLAKADVALSVRMTTVPGAIFSVWHNISGAIIANIFANMKDTDEAEKSEKEINQY